MYVEDTFFFISFLQIWKKLCMHNTFLAKFHTQKYGINKKGAHIGAFSLKICLRITPQ